MSNAPDPWFDLIELVEAVDSPDKIVERRVPIQHLRVGDQVAHDFRYRGERLYLWGDVVRIGTGRSWRVYVRARVKIPLVTPHQWWKVTEPGEMPEPSFSTNVVELTDYIEDIVETRKRGREGLYRDYTVKVRARASTFPRD